MCAPTLPARRPGSSGFSLAGCRPNPGDIACILPLEVLIASRDAGVDARCGRSIWERRGTQA
jgi:hypothetical protein